MPELKGLLKTVESSLVYDDQCGDDAREVTVTTYLFADGLAWVGVRGRGSLEGMRAAAHSFEQSFKCLPNDYPIRVGVDLAGFKGAPLAAQLSLVEWMIRFQGRLTYVGVAGGDLAALKIARAIQRLLPFRRRVGFFEDGRTLLHYLCALKTADSQND